jgi:hypothetical protein
MGIMEGAILLERTLVVISLRSRFFYNIFCLASNLNEYHPLHSDVCGKRSVRLSAHQVSIALICTLCQPWLCHPAGTSNCSTIARQVFSFTASPLGNANCSPRPSFLFPLFIVEGKGDQGFLKVSRFQNGRIMNILFKFFVTVTLLHRYTCHTATPALSRNEAVMGGSRWWCFATSNKTSLPAQSSCCFALFSGRNRWAGGAGFPPGPRYKAIRAQARRPLPLAGSSVSPGQILLILASTTLQLNTTPC